MIEITPQQFSEALNTADDNTRTLMGSETLYQTLMQHKPENVAVDDLLLPFGYYFLRIITEEMLQNELVTLGLDGTQSAELITTVRTSTANTPVEKTLVDQESLPNPESVATTPISPVSPVRTMAADMQNAKEGNTYTSSQEHILNNPETTPTPTSPDDARWQSTN